MEDICIVGGGAAGMTMAIVAKRENPACRIVLVEKNDKLGKKLYATGNGRCNIGNGRGPELHPVLEFFDSLNLMIYEEEEGRFYPRSQQAASVVEALEREIQSLGIRVILNQEVLEIKKDTGTFAVKLKDGSALQSRLLGMTTGGKAAPQFGTTGEGFRLARNLGHTVNRLAPVLMPITCEGDFRDVKGVRLHGKASLWKDGSLVAEESGEVQFTEDGLSGICIFDLTRFLKLEEGERPEEGFRRYTIILDGLPEMNHETLSNYLKKRRALLGKSPGYWILHSIVPTKLIPLIFDRAGILGKSKESAREISDEELNRLAGCLKELFFTVTGGKGWKAAQATAGGVPLEELNQETMESLKIPGLYLAGEITDSDQPCGGYNLQMAWIQGMKAGKAMGSFFKIN